MSDYVTQAVRQKALRDIRAEGPVVLSREDFSQILEWMENPPPKNERLLAAEARYEEMIRQGTLSIEGETPRE